MAYPFHEITLNYLVEPWIVDSEEIDFSDQVTVDEEGTITWDQYKALIDEEQSKQQSDKDKNKNNNMQRHNISMPYLYNFDIRICKLVDVLRRFLMGYNRNNIFEFSNFRK